jgi:hypothetical protein
MLPIRSSNFSLDCADEKWLCIYRVVATCDAEKIKLGWLFIVVPVGDEGVRVHARIGLIMMEWLPRQKTKLE